MRDNSGSSVSDRMMSCGLGSGMNLCFFPPKKLKSERFCSLEYFSFSAFNNSFT